MEPGVRTMFAEIAEDSRDLPENVLIAKVEPESRNCVRSNENFCTPKPGIGSCSVGRGFSKARWISSRVIESWPLALVAVAAARRSTMPVLTHVTRPTINDEHPGSIRRTPERT